MIKDGSTIMVDGTKMEDGTETADGTEMVVEIMEEDIEYHFRFLKAEIITLL